MKFTDFRARALREGLRYGEDRLVFLRELSQNARDAGASRIDIQTKIEGQDLVVEFNDDGSGMSYSHAKRYLFTLYASSKEGETRSAGQYGVGFWSLLLFVPDQIVIESMTADGEAWGMSFDGGLEHQTHVPCRLGSRGTRIVVRRLIRDEDPTKLLEQLEDALKRYCRYLRRNDKQASVLPVNLNRERIDRPFHVEGPCWMAFKSGSVEGAVGLGQRPSVELYARGLLVWHGTTINELRYGAESVDDNTHPEGLAPVYVINGNNLAVTLDRKAVVDNKELARVRRVASRRMRELVGRYLDSISPRPLHERARDSLEGLWEDLKLSGRLVPMAVILSIVLVVAAGLIMATRWNHGDPVSNLPSINLSPDRLAPSTGSVQVPHGVSSSVRFDGPMVEPLGDSASLALKYTPADRDIFFRTIAAEQLNAGKGIVAGPHLPAGKAPAYRCAANCVDLEVMVSAGPGFLPLPVPTGHRIESDSITLGNLALPSPLISDRGQPLLDVDNKMEGKLRYRTGPGTETLDPRRWNDLLMVPSRMRLPPSYAAITATTAAETSPEKKVVMVTSFVRNIIGYDRSRSTADAYRKFMAMSPKAGWTEFVTTIGRGDCDVKNTLSVLMLRRSGIPARLAVGFAGEKGKAAPGMHAWVEYHDGTWVSADASGTPVQPAMAPLPVPDIPGPNPPSVPANDPVTTIDPVTQSPSPPDPTVERDGLTNGTPRTIAVIAALIAAVSGTLGLMLLLAGRGYRKMNAPGGRESRRRIAARMLSNALVQPEIWLKGSGLSSRRLLPVIGTTHRMSLDEAGDLGKKKMLWHSTGLASLARKAATRGVRILNASDEAFGEIVTRLHGTVDLDELSSLKPTLPENLSNDQRQVGQLIGEVDRLVGLAHWPDDTVVPCVGLLDGLSRDVDLSGLKIPLGDGRPSRFVAISVQHPSVALRAGMMKHNPELAAFLLLDMVLPRSELLAPDRELIRLRAACEALEVTR